MTMISGTRIHTSSLSVTAKTLTAYYQLANTKTDSAGLTLLDSQPGAFVVLEECSYDRPVEIARYGHNGNAGDRSDVAP